MIQTNMMKFNNLQTYLLIVFIVFAIQFFILFHIVQVRDNTNRDSKMNELLNVIREQQRLIQDKYINPNQNYNAQLHGIANIKSSNWNTHIPCDTVHVCIVCTGYRSSRLLVTLVKSLVFYRRSYLHLHLIVDRVSQTILDHLFQTWHIPALQISYYSAEQLLPEVEWVKTSHYSGLYGLMKLAVINVLPSNLTKVIILDTDITFNADITELWRRFSKFTSKQAIGLVENQSNWYLKQNANHWPALGRGYNSGVVLLELEKLRAINWKNYWKKTAKSELHRLNTTQLADQDIFNVIIKTTPLLLYELPCEWNVQLSLYTRSESCYKEGTEPKVVHWNSLQREDVPNKHREFFRKLHRTFVEYDGNLLRKGVLGCTPLNLPSHYVVSSSNRYNDLCKNVILAGNVIYRTHIFFIPFNESKTNNDVDVTLVTHLSFDRLLMLEMMASQWTGPISAAIFASDAEAENLVEFVTTSSVFKKRRNIGYHIVYKEFMTNALDLYPVNHLRNVAMDQVKTSFIMHIDVDFITKMKLREYLVAEIQNKNLTADSKALVIAPFETSQHRFGLSFLKKHVLMLWEKRHVAPFRFNMWKHGQYPVNYEKWKVANESYEISWMPFFEPYVVVSAKSPRFDRRFVGFGWNKAAYSMTLWAEGYKFVVLPEACIVHLPHSPSISNSKFRTNVKYRRCMYLLRRDFLSDLIDKYNVTTTTTF